MCKCEHSKNIIVEHIYGTSIEPIKIKLVKGQKSSYGWEVSCAGSDVAAILQQLRMADAALKNEYGSTS